MTTVHESPREEPTRALRGLGWPEVLAGLLVFGACWLFIMPVAARPDTPGGTFAFDFRDTVWVPMKDLLAGSVPWDAAGYAIRHPTSQICPLYLPNYWIFWLPFMVGPYWLALSVWFGFLSAAVVALVRFAVIDVAGLRGRAAFVGGAAVLLFVLLTPPVRSGVLATNWAVVCATAAIIAVRGASSHRWDVALTCLAIVKPQVGLPLLALQLLTGRWRVALHAWLMSILLSLPVGVLVWRNAGGVRPAIDMFRDTLSRGEGVPLLDPFSTRLDLIGTLGHQGILPPGWVLALITLGVAVVTLGSATVVFRRCSIRSPWFLLTAGFAILLIAPNWLYAVTVIVPPLVGLVAMLWQRQMPSSARFWAALCLASALVPFITFQSLAVMLGVSTLVFNTLNGFALNVGALFAAVAAVVASRIPYSSDGSDPAQMIRA